MRVISCLKSFTVSCEWVVQLKEDDSQGIYVSFVVASSLSLFRAHVQERASIVAMAIGSR